MMEVGIIGYGFVGKATGQLAVKDEIRVVPFDLYQDEYNSPEQMITAYSADYVIVCVPTPMDPEDGSLNVDIVVDAARKWNDINQNPESVLVIKSTIPVGTVSELIEFLDNERIVHNPEFLTERTAMEDFMFADEIIVGGEKRWAQKVMDLYEQWADFHPSRAALDHPKYKVTDAVTAEMVKIVRNSFYATKVEFMNEVADLCEAMKIDYAQFRDVFARSGKQAWVNPQHTTVPGPDGKRGFGGKCLPKDASGLEQLAKSYGVNMPVLKAANKTNKGRRPEGYNTIKNESNCSCGRMKC